MENKTDEIVIRALKDSDAVRTRPGMYIGAVTDPSLIFREVIDGSLDESYANPSCNKILISMNFNGYYFCCDNGRGIPCSMSIDDPSKTQALLAMSKLHAGSKFETQGIRAGMHGVGESVANFLSNEFIMLSKITEDNYNKSIPAVKELWDKNIKSKKDLFYIICFQKGELKYEGALSKKDIEKMVFKPQFPNGYTELPVGMSTCVLFRPDDTIFESIKAELPIQNLQNFLLIQEKFYKRKVTVDVDGQIMTSTNFKPYKFEFIRTIVPKDNSLNDQVSMYITFEVDPGLGSKTETGSVNGLVVNQGIHINWAEQLFAEALVTEYKIRHKQLLNGLKMHVLLLASEVLYDSQTKTRLRSISKVKIEDFKDIVKDFIKSFRKDPEYWQLHVDKLDQLANSMKSIGAMEKAQKIIDSASGSQLYKTRTEMVEGFADATALPGNRWDCELFICEGLSPAGSLKSGRKTTKYHAVLPLRGKILNVKDSSVDQALSNKEIFTIFRVIGLGIDINNVTSNCKTVEEAQAAIQKSSRYGKIVICTD